MINIHLFIIIFIKLHLSFSISQVLIYVGNKSHLMILKHEIEFVLRSEAIKIQKIKIKDIIIKNLLIY